MREKDRASRLVAKPPPCISSSEDRKNDSVEYPIILHIEPQRNDLPENFVKGSPGPAVSFYIFM